ncbi:tRNA (cytosine(34)-C(5))-methyltransferase, mitochondrial-like [Clinocottus analis]|uniref:tRNA (cytosine(34)-C(5))-methyltransferase, mitochondrial-like n=1 Tax=Clinocottus analis TaxID=304258 RepID=UPI0035C1FB38
MSKYRISTRQSSSAWRSLAPTWGSWAVHCHSGPEEVLQPEERTGALDEQVTKRCRKVRSSCQSVLYCFDQQYSQELGDLWASTRAVLLDPPSWQYGVMLNRFSALTGVTQVLQSQGFSTLLCNGPSTLLQSKYQAVKDSLLRPDYLSKCPPHDSHLQPDSPSHALGQDLQSEPSRSLSHPTLQCYIHPRPVRFPSQAHRPGQLKQYYLLNAASLLPVLALKVRDGERVLDLCSAPGGKSIAIMQCATPALLCCNEPDPHRRNWLAKTLESFLSQSLSSRVVVSAQDGRSFGKSDAGTYDKVLVDAPCSNDRSWLYCGSQQGEQRLKERARLPALQAQLLRSALSAVRPGGVVVYSTCTLSSFENSAVVEAVLNECPEAEPEDLWEEIAIPLSTYFTFRTAHPGHGQTPRKPSLQPQNGSSSSYHHDRLGILVLPQPGKTWGPMFLSRIRRRK